MTMAQDLTEGREVYAPLLDNPVRRHEPDGIVVDPLSDEHEALTFHRLRAENPKDAVGSKKLSFAVLPWRVLTNVALAMLEGALKYGRQNYRAAGVRASVYFDAVVGRHLTSWWEGEDIDPDSGLSHITKAIASLVVLRDSMMQDKFNDDRPPKSAPWLPDLNARSEALFDKYPDPKHPYREIDATWARAAAEQPEPATLHTPRGTKR
jgi:hypothetical protein